MIGKLVGQFFSSARDLVAKGLIKLKVTPNVLSLTGMLITLAAGVCFAIGTTRDFAMSLDPAADANAYLLLAGVLLILASACDMLDGAVARLGNMKTEFGGFLDSTLDRYSDFVVYAGIAVAYAWHEPANITFMLLAVLAFFNGFMISYTRARAEDIIPKCRVGYWQRGERSAAILFATFAYNPAALVVQQGISPMFTALRRIFYTKAVLDGKQPVTDPRKGSMWLKLRPWLWPRMTVPYDIITGMNVAWLIFARIPSTDLLRQWFA